MDKIQENKAITRKEREKQARQQDILKAARELFIKKGYHETTLEEIARHAEFGKGTIYNYFSSKEELFFGIIDRMFDETGLLVSEAVANASGGAREKCLAFAEAMISHARDNSDFFHLIIREIHSIDNDGSLKSRIKDLHDRSMKFWGLLAEPIAGEVRAGNVRPVNEMELAVIFEGMVRFQCIMQIEKLYITQNENIHEAAALITSIFFDGISEPKIKG
jgi:TetR/AcrR family transcriptional regulator, repressor of fatR-cypB operon